MGVLSNVEEALIMSALILSDDNIEITAEKLNTLLNAANVEVEAFWAGLYAKALAGVDVKSLLSNFGAGMGAGAAAPEAAAEEKKEEAPAEEEESDDDMGFGLFD